MKFLGKDLKKGIVKVVPESMDDLWHLYNVIHRNDAVYAYSSREIKPDEGGYGRPKRGERVSVFLGVRVESVTWDKLVGKLRIHGTICEAPEIVPTGAHHTLTIALNTPLTIVKKAWAKHEVERLEKACRVSEKPILIIAIDDEGYAVATTAQYGIEVKAEESVKLPGKHEAEKRDDAKKAYFKKALNTLRQMWTLTHVPIVIIGVGFVKNDFAKFLDNEAADIAESVLDVKSVNNDGVAGIYEALRSGVLQRTMKQQRVLEETEVIEEVLKRLGKGEGNVTYGLEEVKKATETGAVEKLIVADSVLRKGSDEERLFIEEMMKSVEQKGGSLIVVSTEHEAGAKLTALSGIAALLRFPLR